MNNTVVIGGEVGLNKKIDGSVNLKNTVDGTTGLAIMTGGSLDHRKLRHRDAADQHPISAITGLQDLFDDTWILYCGTSEEVIDETV